MGLNSLLFYFKSNLCDLVSLVLLGLFYFGLMYVYMWLRILSSISRSIRISEAIEDALAYTRLTDNIVQEILSSDNVKLTEVSSSNLLVTDYSI